MSSYSTPACVEVQEQNPHDVSLENKEMDVNGTENVPEEEDEDGDADFNPFLKENSSVEASSSLSSDIEDVDADVADSRGKSLILVGKKTMEIHGESVKDGQTSENVDNVEEFVSHTENSSKEVCGMETGLQCGKVTESSVMDDNTATILKNPMVEDLDASGAICMRTRARYSLASFTLDELETFLQESDDEDDLQNADEEEEYRKFLYAVLRGDGFQNLQGIANADDEDDNDADFELELEELLESEPEEVEQIRITRPSRNKKTLKSSNQKLSEKLNKPLRPLLPCGPIGSFLPMDGKHCAPTIPPTYTLPVNNGVPFGFTLHQIRQLHCLIHEHVQLLIQVFALSVLEPAKRNVATEVKKLIGEMLQKRGQVLSWRTVPQPSCCFFPPDIHPSLSNKGQEMIPPKDINEDVHCDMSISQKPAGSSQTPECNSWVPYVCGPVMSVIDVAPLRLVENFMDDVSSAVQAYERYQIEVGPELCCQKEPLFRIQIFPCSSESDDQGGMENNSPISGGTIINLPGNQAKKTMAAAVLEKVKDRPVALVQKDIAKLSQRFLPLFNPALYPHKAPPPAIANRVHFTDAEDELLALGLMEYNADWKAIQQRYLPCKSRHQIFVRQKNRASSKTPYNPIKAVRRMKNAPLTSEEITRIDMGLRRFKLDWISIWRSFVPYRDPSLLPRQWRIACGTQKSYKSDANKNENRRLNDLRRRASKPYPSTRVLSSEKEGDSSDDAADETNRIDKGDEAYVHEAFLADCRQGDSNVSSSIPACMLSHEGSIQHQISSKFVAGPRPQVTMRPYRVRRKNARLVKLAPDLPPVNLPRSVRIISQSAFKSSQAVTSGNISAPRTLVDTSVRSGPSTNTSVDITAKSRPLNESRAPDIHMHPLLFQTPHDGRLPYYAMNCSTSTSHFSFLHQPHTSLGLFHNPQHKKDAVNCISKSSKSPGKNLSTSSGAVDFHPLLQKSNDVDAPFAASCPTPCIEWGPQKCVTQHNPYASISRKANELDLDIHLCFLSKNQEASERVDVAACEAGELRSGAASGAVGSETAKAYGKERDPGQDRMSDGLCSDNVLMVSSNNEGSGKILDAVGDESLPGIIMEQEELSDSEDEFGDDVEFEREEMADSDGDRISEAEHTAGLTNENVPLDETNADSHDGRASGGRGAASVKDKPNSSSFNLNACPPVFPPLNTAAGGCDFDFELFGTMSEQLSANSKASRWRAKQGVDPIKKPRKRVCRSKCSLDAAGSEKGNLNLETDASVEN